MATKQTPIRFAVPPGQIIRGELEAREWSQETLAKKMDRPYQAVNAIVNGHKTITADTAIELGNAFGTSPVYWMNLQTAYQLYQAHQKRKSAVMKYRVGLEYEKEDINSKKIAAKRGIPTLDKASKSRSANNKADDRKRVKS